MDQFFYQKLIVSDPLGFIAPLKDLGEFDFVQMKFKHPVKQLINKYSGQPYRSFNAFMVAQMGRIATAGGLDLYDNSFAESLVDIKEQQAQILELLIKNEIKLQYTNLKQETVEELTTMWLDRFMNQ